MEVLTSVKDILQMARDERCSSYTADLLIQDLNELSALREAGEKMAEQLRCLRDFQQEAEARGQSSITVEVDHIFNSEDAASLAEWEAANK